MVNTIIRCAFLALVLLQLAHCQNIITTTAGTGTGSYSGDGGQAFSANITYPHGIDFDSSGNIYFSDYNNNVVRKITIASGIITTFAGGGSSVGDGSAATSAGLYHPNGLCVDSSGIDQSNSSIISTKLRVD